MSFCTTLLLMLLSCPGIAQDATPTSIACPDCDGAGTRECNECNHRGRVEVDCDHCGTRGTEPCTQEGCKRGRLTCKRCDGRGFDGGKVCRTCKGKKKVSCTRCTKGKMECTACEGELTVLKPCPICKARRRFSCHTCEGRGELTPIPLPGDVISRLDEIRIDLDTYRRDLEKARQIHLDQEPTHATLGARAADLEGRAQAIVDRPSRDLPGALRKWKTQVAAGLKSFRLAHTDQLRSGAAAPGLDSEVSIITSALTAIEEEMTQIRTTPYARSELVPRDRIRSLRRRLDDHREQIFAVSLSAQKLETSGRKLRNAVEALEVPVSAFEEEEGRLSRDRHTAAQALSGRKRAVERLQAWIGDEAGKHGIPEPELEPRDPDEDGLHLEIRCLDREVGVVRQVTRVEPRAKWLEHIPALVSAVFEQEELVRSVRLELQVLVLSDTGHESPETCQKFDFERDRWQELTTGAFRDDWSKLLSKANPSPPFPRPRRFFGFLGNPAYLSFFFAAGAGLAAVIVVSMRIIRHSRIASESSADRMGY